MALPGLSFEVVRSAGPVLGIRADRVAILALTERGLEESPVLVRSDAEFTREFGVPVDGMLGPLAARVFFQNGGEELIVTRFVPGGATRAAGSLRTAGATDGPILTAIGLAARDRGAFGNRLRVDAFVTVRLRAKGEAEVTAAGTTSAVTFRNVLEPVLDASAIGLPVRLLAAPYEPWALVATVGALEPELDGVGDPIPGVFQQTITLNKSVQLAAETLIPVPPRRVRLIAELHEPTFALRIRERDRADVVVPGLDLRDMDAAREKLAGAAVTITTPDASLAQVELPEAGPVARLAGALDGLEPEADMAALRVSFENALAALEQSDLPDIMIAPDLWSRVFRTKGVNRLAFDARTAVELADEMVQSAARTRDRVVLLDPPLAGRNDLVPLGVGALEEWRAEREAALEADRDFAAAYTPWTRIVAGPLFKGDDTLLLPPSATVAGQMALTSRERGPWIATGNVALEPVVSLEQTLTVEEQERLQDVGINPLRMTLPRGATIQGVRALSWPDRKSWRFLSTRRLFNYLRRALRPIGLSYVFEPNAPETWIALRRDVERLLRDLHAAGGLAGAVAEQGFFVKIDADNNPEDARQNGVLTAEIGVAPAFPLEFLVVRLIVGRGVATVTEEPIAS